MRFVLSLDYDGTLIYGTWNTRRVPRMDVVAKTLEFCKHPFCDVILWTCREESLLVEAIQHCESLGLKFDAVNMNTDESLSWSRKKFGRVGHTCGRKIYADLYVDDRSPGSIEHFLTLDPETEWCKVKARNKSTDQGLNDEAVNDITLAFLSQKGWIIDSQSPLIIRHQDGAVAIGRAARIVMLSLSEEAEWFDHQKQFEETIQIEASK